MLTTPAEIDTWLTASPEEALKLQRPLQDGVMKIVGEARRKTRLN